MLSIIKGFVRYGLSLPVVFVISILQANGQQLNGIQTINAYVDSLQRKLSPEKIYLQTDKNYYSTTDTIWLKGYLFDAQFLTASAKSGVVYVDIIHNDKIESRLIFEADDGLFSGAIPLGKYEIGVGIYTLRVYTNWMRNRGNEVPFSKSVYIINNNADQATNSRETKSSKPGPKSSITMANAPDIDLQFMPEGGKLINGISSCVGFKAITANGQGIDVRGKVYDGGGKLVTTLKSLHNGMGVFELKPVAGEKYSAVITWRGKELKQYSIPRAISTGIVLQVTDYPDAQAVKIKLQASPDILRNAVYNLVMQSRGVVCYGAMTRFADGVVNIEIPKSKFPTGIARITLFDENLHPVCERIVFIDRHDSLNLNLQTEKQNYLTRDSVSLKLKVTNQKGEPVQGSFSMAVTDDGLTVPDTTDNILTQLLLTSDLRGTIDNPAYYFTGKADSWTALDCLLLTQGWVGYTWNNHFEVPAVKYPAEPEFAIAGKITNLLNKGVPNTPVKLFSRHPFFTMDTITNAGGYFAFRNLPSIDTASFLLQAVKRNGKSMNVGFEMQDTEPLPVITGATHALRNVADSSLQILVDNNIEVKQKTAVALLGKHVLKAVVIKGKKAIKGSHNLNGPGNADEVIDEKDLLKANKTPLMELLTQRINGFHEGMFPVRLNSTENTKTGNNNMASTFTDKNLNTRKNSYVINVHRVKFIFDGIDAESYFQPADLNEGPLERFLFLKGVIEQFSSEEVKGIEVMYSGKYNNVYNFNISSAYELSHFISPVNDVDYAYIEITTRSGKGPFLNSKDGFYGYRPLMPTWSKEFYTPKYQARETPLKIDFRSTLHWQPNIITDSAGKATIKFFTSDRTGTFTIITQGSDMNGQLGFAKSNFKVQ